MLRKYINKTYIYTITLIIILFSFITAYSQDEFSAGSPYNIYGLGDYIYSSSIRTDAMGIQGIALYGDYVNNMNPASNSRLSFTNLTASAEYYLQKSSDNNISSRFSDLNVNGFNIGIPFSQNNGWVLTLGFNPITNINYKITNQAYSNGVPYKKNFYGSGGLSRINAGMSYKVFKVLTLAAEYNYAFGNKVDLKYYNFNTSGFINTYQKYQNNFDGSYFKAGFIFDAGSFFKSDLINNLAIGFIYQTKCKLYSTYETITGSSIGFDTTSVSDYYNISFPEAFGFGITNKFGQRFLMSADLLIQQWSKFSVANVKQENYQDAYRFGIGFEIQPPNRSDRTVLEDLTYRFGFFYDRSYFKINNDNINRYGITAGINIPLYGDNSIDISLSYYIRGSRNNGLIQDENFRIAAGLNFGELWFIKAREE
ncbi:MAG: hypothetical protein FJ216_01635 [Ignavibacteria bacterium]|nr:hypothetical protein [Ignavibacteria bacterium]